MFVVIWQFRVKPQHISDFERNYGANGAWAQLFRTDPAYHRTVLQRDLKDHSRYVTTDIWKDEASYRAFQERSRRQYQELDSVFVAFTESETLIGYFEVIE
ncbi:MAG TPA: antibiotic biosynthesis monooxygenase [Terriglobales bacterium]|nr:antibiotic biosynthesis monooxygenase [Terriglobales bacterium]